MKLQFDKKYDVAVVGGGVAGVAAALQAARSGMRTALIEKTVLLGGLATSGIVLIYLPLCDGNGRQVTFGIAEELLRASLKYGPGKIPEKWREGCNAQEKDRFRVAFSPASFILAIDELLKEAGVDTWLDTLVCDAKVTGGRVSGVICENESGRGRIRARQFIDASGSCILARRAGIACHDDFNFLSVWAILFNRESGDDKLGENLQVFVDSVPWDPEKAPKEGLFRGISGKMVSDFVFKGRRLVRDELLRAYADGSGRFDRETFFPLKVPAMPQFRKIFSIDAEYVLDGGENNKAFPDSIGMVGDWRKAGPVWEIPYRSLYPANHLGGFLAAGRCTGARGDAWEITRVIPTAALTGQVAGLAAAMCVKAKREPYSLPVEELQAELRDKHGFKIHLGDVGL